MGQHASWYNTRRWRQRRLAQLQAQPLCVFHEKQNQVVMATIADHVHPHRGDEDLFWHGELQSLCKQCHDSLKQQQEHKGYHNAIGVDGWPIDPQHPVNRPRWGEGGANL